MLVFILESRVKYWQQINVQKCFYMKEIYLDVFRSSKNICLFLLWQHLFLPWNATLRWYKIICVFELKINNFAEIGRVPLNHSPTRQWRVCSRIWRAKIAYLLASVASDIFQLFYMKYKQSMWIEYSHVAYQWKPNQIF